MALFGLVSAVAGFVKVRFLIDKAIIDNLIFRCHYRITSAILFVFCILVTANNLIGESQSCGDTQSHLQIKYNYNCFYPPPPPGDPIQCISEGSIPGHVISTYCWVTYTFTLPGEHGRHVGTEVAQSGLGNDNQAKTFHSYYQWVPFVLFFQGVCFYVPHMIWKNWEDGKMRMITDGLRGVLTIPSEERASRQSRLVHYINKSLKMHNSYAFGYFFCEMLNFLNVIINIVMIDRFLGGTFMTYGTDVLRMSNINQENRSDPMVSVFPRVTKCTFHKYGPSGSIQKHDAMCILAVNILNEKIYIFLWFWLIILAVLSGCAIIYSALVVMLPTTRETIIKRRFRNANKSDVTYLINHIQVRLQIIFKEKFWIEC